MGKGNFAGSKNGASTENGNRRGGMMGRAKRATGNNPAVGRDKRVELG